MGKKRGWETKILKEWGQAGSKSGYLKKRGGDWNLLTNYGNNNNLFIMEIIAV